VITWQHNRCPANAKRDAFLEDLPGGFGRQINGALKAWFDEAKLAQRTTSQDVKMQYAYASIIANN
jgi:hypothetical protein